MEHFESDLLITRNNFQEQKTILERRRLRNEYCVVTAWRQTFVIFHFLALILIFNLNDIENA